ncbi:molybdopterin-binding protein [Alicyclobacillus vulcanalis]|uniref:Molybdenum cofactor synthesis domain-containing protein n=1 Tax=Alicyclobacillus vulcanalis TaxID=252246 RepID=A0A1N7N7H7_9BACL|nr:molybdopterin-binding protein [Alicyclobacillus vulcanalis]SIS94323.1 molybdenum cofactor synthesis domain-containing protein [Alicyclobacillus vulcanalis]
MEYNLLRKTEMRVRGVHLNECHLGELAGAIAKCLGLPHDRVITIDVREREIAFDLLLHEIPAEMVVGREQALLSALSAVPGVTLDADASVSADGVLGLIALPEEMRESVLHASARMGDEVANRVRRRALVFPTGYEVRQGLIEDTNTPYLMRELEQMGYRVSQGEVLPDDLDAVIGAFYRAIEDGYGLVITTGGVGAEAKDVNVEAMEAVCEEVFAPYIVRFTQVHHRHQKPGIRVGVGQSGVTKVINLPGPHDEVVLCFQAIRPLLDEGPDVIARAMADAMKQRWMTHAGHAQKGHGILPDV